MSDLQKQIDEIREQVTNLQYAILALLAQQGMAIEVEQVNLVPDYDMDIEH